MKSAVTNGAPVMAPIELEQVPITSLRSERVRRPSFMIVGVLLVLLAALAGAMLFRASTSRSRALVLNSDMAVGQELLTTDLTMIELDVVPNLQWVPFDEQGMIVGLSARGPLVSGQLVAKSMFTERAATIGADTVIVAVAMSPGAIPPTAQIGDTVRMQLTGETGGSSAVTTESVPIGEAVVWSMTEAGSSPGGMIVELAVPVDIERVASQAASSGRMKLNLTGQE